MRSQSRLEKVTISRRLVRVIQSSKQADDPFHRRAGLPRLIRLNKFLSSAGIASRRKADELIQFGSVTVNGQKVTTLGFRIDPSRDKICVSGKQVAHFDEHVYIVLNKPKDCITTTDDEKGRRTVLDLVQVKERVYPVGRLDRNTTGVLLLTNDGELAHRMMHPRYEVRKGYEVELDVSLSQDAVGRLRTGLLIDGERTAPAEVHILPESKRRRIGIIIHEGKNRQVRRMLEALGYKVLKLHRVTDGLVTAEGLARGEWRLLTKREIAALKRHVGLS
jgi:23S rRNA pseudouridine2605 synthase